MVLRQAFALFALVVLACSVDLAPLEKDPEQTGGKGAKGGSGGSGASSQGGASATGGIGGSGLGQSGGGTGSTGDPCTDCVITKCTTFDAACNASTECSAIRACIKACTTPACQFACYDQHPAFNDYYALESCVYQSCPVDCQIWSQDCWDCDQTNCMGPLKNCMSDYECLAYWNCISTCTEQTCVDVCTAKYPLGMQFDAAYQTCSFSMCKTPCYP